MRHSYRLVLDFRPLCDNLLGALTQLGLLACYTTSFVMRLAASKFVVPATLARSSGPDAGILRNRWEHCNVDFRPPSVSDETLSHRCLECVFELCALLHRNASQYPRLVRGSVAPLEEPRGCEARDHCPRQS
jgi:hypothetical protein